MEDSRAFYTASSVRWRSTTSAATAGRGVRVAVASSRASSDEDEDDDVSFVFIHAKGYLGRDGLCWAGAAGLLVGCHGQVRSGKVFPLFLFYLFSVFYFYFEFRFEFKV
jgi:hypothetical protein